MPEEYTLRDMLHNTRILSAGVIAVGAVLGSLAYTGAFTSLFLHHTEDVSTPEPKTSARQLTEKDENNNGIPDWQELHTSSNTTTQDSSSTQDAARGDTSSHTVQSRGDLQKKYTKTELLAGDLFGAYLERKESGEYTSADGEAIVANALDGLDISYIPHFTESDVIIETPRTNDTPGDAAARTYRDAVHAVIQSLDTISEYELQTYARATEKNDPVEFKKVSDAADVYATAVESLKKIPVPKDAVGAHLALMNGFTKLSLALLEMSKGYDDIAGSYAALKTFGEAEKDIDLAYTLQKTYLAIHNAIDL